MPRKPKVQLAEQVYNLPQYGPEARVTIVYDANHAPPFYQPAPGVVIVGDHVCQPAFRSPAGYTTEPPADQLPPRESNLLDVNDPRYQERLEMLQAGGGRVAAPGAVVKVYTSEDAFEEIGAKLDVGELEAAARG